jgi:hypothetical protein
VCSIWTLGVYLLNDYIRGELIKIPLLMSLHLEFAIGQSKSVYSRYSPKTFFTPGNHIVKEAAQMAIYAEVLGGAKAIPPEMLQATVGRRDEFARAGTQRA